jgi:hypothetical protein
MRGAATMRSQALRMLLAGCALLLADAAAAQEFSPPRTEWGDPDFRGTWPLELLSKAGIPLERAEGYGERQLMTDEEFAGRLQAAARPNSIFALDDAAAGTVGVTEWLQSTPFGRRTSLLVDPPNGRLPPLTPEASALYAAGRNSFKDGQPIDWLTDLDAYDRCIVRNLSAAIFPWPENNGIRIFQSPGYVVLQLEVLGTRVIPVGHGERWPQPMRSWLGQSLGRWEGDTLVIETTAIVAGDSASPELANRASSPISGRPTGVTPIGGNARAVERLTMTGPDTIAYEVTYSDPDVFTAPWTAAYEWTRNEDYRIYEFACHEGNTIRDMITGSRAYRALGEGVARGSGNAQQDGTGRWAFPELEGDTP